MGSSPRVWEQGHCCCTLIKHNRIIPTRMGTRVVNQLRHSLHKDHPHAYGDKSYAVALANSTPGSSPRVWGQAAVRRSDVKLYRIIPTRMGTSAFSSPLLSRSRDHPHAYGDKTYQLILRLRMAGSSPRVWGQDLQTKTIRQKRRIIPTRVGTSPTVKVL